MKDIDTCEGQNKPWKKSQIRRERPHLFGFQPPQNNLGSLPPPRPKFCARRFFHGSHKTSKHKSPKEAHHVSHQESSCDHNPASQTRRTRKRTSRRLCPVHREHCRSRRQRRPEESSFA